MALFTCQFRSTILDSATAFNVNIPDNFEEDSPWILLLHGLKGEYSEWERYTSIERYTRPSKFVVVMPSGGDSFYTDEVYGKPYYSYIVQELIPYVQKVFKVSKKREKMFIAGLSMGGYGALKIGLRNPDTFAAIASFSGCLDIYDRFTGSEDCLVPNRVTHANRCWGLDYKEVLKPCKGNKENLFNLLEDFDYKGNVPWIYTCCGTEDQLYPSNEKFHEAVSKLPIHHEWHKKPGIHAWDIWDFYVQDALRFFQEYLDSNEKWF